MCTYSACYGRVVLLRFILSHFCKTVILHGIVCDVLVNLKLDHYLEYGAKKMTVLCTSVGQSYAIQLLLIPSIKSTVVDILHNPLF